MADILSRREIEQITGIAADHPIRQRNRLLKQGIYCVLNDCHEVVVWRSWVDAAALPKEFLSKYIQKLAVNDDEDDIGLNLDWMKHGQKA